MRLPVFLCFPYVAGECKWLSKQWDLMLFLSVCYSTFHKVQVEQTGQKSWVHPLPSLPFRVPSSNLNLDIFPIGQSNSLPLTLIFLPSSNSDLASAPYPPQTCHPGSDPVFHCPTPTDVPCFLSLSRSSHGRSGSACHLQGPRFHHYFSIPYFWPLSRIPLQFLGLR